MYLLVRLYLLVKYNQPFYNMSNAVTSQNKFAVCDTSPGILFSTLVVQFVAESRFANCEFANLFFDFDEFQFS